MELLINNKFIDAKINSIQIKINIILDLRAKKMQHKEINIIKNDIKIIIYIYIYISIRRIYINGKLAAFQAVDMGSSPIIRKKLIYR